MFGKSVLLKRLESEVVYLREQNKLLLDRLMAFADPSTYRQVKHDEHMSAGEQIELERVKRINPEILKAEQEQKRRESEIMTTQLKMMAGG